jgi:sterol 3beta-glucosyltransferase
MALFGAELQRRGHEVTVGLPPDLMDFGTALGVKTVPLGLRIKDFLGSDEGRRLLAAGDVHSYLMLLFEKRLAVADEALATMLDMTADADVIVSGSISLGEAACIAEARHIPLVTLQYAPWQKNSHFVPLVMTQRRYPGPVNRLVHNLVARAERKLTGDYFREFRARLGLPRRARTETAAFERSAALEIQAYSRHLVPELAAWHPRRPLVGFCALPAEERRLLGESELDPTVDQWLADGEPPVFLGFGSMPVQDMPAMMNMADDFGRRLGTRVLVGAGWSDYRPEDVPDPSRVRIVGAIDHDRVLPRCRLAVHHGGAGTTAASIRAGLPAVICPVAFDQWFWGQQLERLGVGRVLPFARLDTTSLLRAAEPLLADEPKRRAARLAGLLREEDAAGRAADLIEQVVTSRPPGPRTCPARGRPVRRSSPEHRRSRTPGRPAW